MNKELNFRPHSTVKGGVQCKIKTDNGYTISIVGGHGLYGDGKTTFEVAAWEGDNGDWIKLSPYNDVLPNQTIDEVHQIIDDISNGVFKQYK
jgi:intein/homing endonuclease